MTVTTTIFGQHLSCIPHIINLFKHQNVRAERSQFFFLRHGARQQIGATRHDGVGIDRPIPSPSPRVRGKKPQLGPRTVTAVLTRPRNTPDIHSTMHRAPDTSKFGTFTPQVYRIWCRNQKHHFFLLCLLDWPGSSGIIQDFRDFRKGSIFGSAWGLLHLVHHSSLKLTAGLRFLVKIRPSRCAEPRQH